MGVMRHPKRNLRQRVAVGAVGVLTTVTTLTACDIVNKPPTPDQAAKALAGGLAGGDLNQVRFDGATSANVAAFLATAVGDLKDVKRTVTVSQVSEPKSNERTATATLAFAWTLPSTAPPAVATAPGTASGTATASGSASATTPATGGGTDVVWSYTTTSSLTRAQDDTWHVTWTPAVFAPNLTGTEKLALTTVKAKRGDIVGANSVPLMTPRDTAQVGIDKTKVSADQQAAAATALAQLAGADPGAYAKSVASAGAKAFVPLLTVRADDPLLTTQTAAVTAIPGAV